MSQGDFAIALSERSDEDAIREVSLRVKAYLPKAIKYLIILSTPHYEPTAILKTINLTLKPLSLLCMRSPFVIFEERIIEKGIVAWGINKEEAELRESIFKNDEPETIESSLRLTFRDPLEKQFIFSLLPSKSNPYSYLQGVNLAVGKAPAVAGAGYIKKYPWGNYQIINNTINEDLLTIIGSGLDMEPIRVGGFSPIGRPFTITKIGSKKNIIAEIDGKPAITIYKHYLEEKFDSFRKNHLFSLYPLGIKHNGCMRLINVMEELDDGSLVCVGDIKEHSKTNLMLLYHPFLFECLSEALLNLEPRQEGIVFMINSLLRKKILKDYAEEEIKFIKYHLGSPFKLIGIYSDYTLFSDRELGRVTMEASSLLLTVWK